jgi:hypothetical protein
MTQAIHSVPMMTPNRESTLERVNEFLDKSVLPFPVRYLTNRIVILGTLCLLIPLIAFANVTVFVLAANSYLNVMSVVVSSTVLLYSTLSEARDRAAAERREQIAAQHQTILDQRAEADHKRIEAIYQSLTELHDQTVANINASLESIQKSLIDHSEVNQAEDHAHIEQINKALLASIASHKEELADLRKLVQVAGKGK